jgi:predicted  nucleic acid-binding Zn-ribbon protein
MELFKKLAVFGFVIALGLTLVATPALAVNDVSGKAKSGQCVAKTRRVTNISRFFVRQETRIVGNYERRVARLETLSARFAANGGDVTALNEDVATLKTMINGLKTDIDDVQAKADALKSMTCDDETWQQAQSDLFAAQQKVRNDRRSINRFIGTEIGADLESLDQEDQS